LGLEAGADVKERIYGTDYLLASGSAEDDQAEHP
jgi:hypothetical protein